ncbi:MAG TPA: GntR family transcriptional regulator [Dongiaceae bacterium]|jgi:DNA-binding GntR family transcriptional regulator
MPDVSSTSSSAKAYEKLKLLILQGEIARGEPLIERTIAERLGVSRTPVRETIQRLEREGLVRVIEGKGAFVASYTAEDLIEIYQLREALEPLAARLACDHMESDVLDRFEGEFNRQKADPRTREDDPDSWTRLGRAFHEAFIQASGNERLVKVISGMQEQIELFRGLGRTISPNAISESTVDEHLEILHALKTRDPLRAETAVKVHLQNALHYRLEGLRLYGRRSLS